ncbi:pyridoxamine 5'-phosphate oxidase family protein [Paenibacillus sp. SC116]|uniref:HugZ family pyridoxamine 5'-phosphate oxidase n=1 Tax=Paenibacillus sp. SC116 TaxID=2968986 RepID=UPI00215A2112|nr:pyridoxamine 5'-phosphate oxidase family protein [Paenibacillus sp. SC116]MCR8844246.1 pyridoxamine 5'-phosphate oxidase family protein [Paenibacillus sp. SC116]
MKPIDMEATKQRYIAFIESCKSIVISSTNEQGVPFISYAPVVKYNEKLYIYISQISDHYYYVDSNEHIHVMMIADEAKSPNVFARERARWVCTTANLGNEGHDDVFAQFDAAFGESMMKLLRGLDFSLFELTPVEGRYVVGFGQAFNVNLSGSMLEHVVVDRKEKE